jgi:archaellum component FlaF (FlaF/FlaG flagellin family)
MGFSSITATLIMFIAVMGLATGVIVVMKTSVDETSASLSIRSDILKNTLQTEMDISSISYNNITETTTVNIQNVGKTKLKLEYVDIFVDGAFIPRNSTNRTIYVQASTDTKNPGIWDPHEILEIQVFKNMTLETHDIVISSQYGSRVEDSFSI